MCARYSLHSPLARLQEQFGFAGSPPVLPRYNIAPSKDVLAVRLAVDGRREGVVLRWGLAPAWATDRAPLVNARAETAAEKPAFREAMRARRCLVLADGFYEWRDEGGRKQPYYVSAADREPFGIAALYEPPRDAGDLPTCVLLTVDANEAIRLVHERMPLIVPREHHAAWLDPATTPDALASLLAPLPASAVEVRAVSTRVNSTRNEGPDLLGPPEQTSLF